MHERIKESNPNSRKHKIGEQKMVKAVIKYIITLLISLMIVLTVINSKLTIIISILAFICILILATMALHDELSDLRREKKWRKDQN
jgi:uncharacterized protein YacL